MQKQRKFKCAQNPIVVSCLIFTLGCGIVVRDCNAQDYGSYGKDQTSVSEDGSEKAVSKIAEYMRKKEEELNRKTARYLKKAEDALNGNNFDRARDYIEKAKKVKEEGQEEIKREARKLAEQEARKNAEIKILRTLSEQISGYDKSKAIADKPPKDKALKPSVKIEQAVRTASSLMEQINKAEKAHEEQKKEKQKALGAEIKSLNKKAAGKISAKKEAKLREQTKKMEAYLAEAEKLLDKNEFEKARKYVEKAMEVKEASRQIVEDKVKRTQNKETVRDERKAKAWAALELEEKIVKCLDEAKDAVTKSDFKTALRYAHEALKLESGNPDAEEMVKQIELARKSFEEEKVREEEKARKEGVLRAERKEEERKLKKKVERYLEKAENALNKKDFSLAMDYAEQVIDMDSNNSTASAMIKEIKSARKNLEEEKTRKEEALRAERKGKE
ncbi:MAG: hypothetical protein KJ864_00425, partial [Candidatus Omnitrophica bacterium]|nr:hypothetical protein [Candidatus Omnitrophota bacterium]